jgi:glycosyltransferase involved in cell wall biosynthesis
MRILHINSYYISSILYKNLYDNQIDDGLNVATYVSIPAGTDVPVMYRGDYTTISANHNKYDRLFFYAKHRKICNDIITKYELDLFDIIHAHSLFSNGYIALKIKQLLGIPYVVAVRNTDVNIFLKYMFHLRKLGIAILKASEKVIFLSKPYRDFVIDKYVPVEFKKIIFNKSEVIPNGIDEFWIKNKGGSKTGPKQPLKLVYAGIIDKNKNITTTIKAIELLKRKGYDIKFTIVGRIEDKNIFNQIIKKPYIQYLTQRPKEKLIEIYRANDIFVMPSIHETFGLVYAEAMSQGLPVIYTQGQGFDMQFDDGEVGYSVNCFDCDDIANKICAIVANYSEMSNRCLDNCNKFDWKYISKKYISIYDDIKRY